MPTYNVEDDDGKCPLCYGRVDEAIRLHCGHRVHSRCILEWWVKSYENPFTCPFCRAVDDNACYIEIVRNAGLPYAVGFYWKDEDLDQVVIERLIYYDKTFLTKIQKIPKNGANRLKSYMNFLLSVDHVTEKFGCPDEIITSKGD